MLIATGLPKEPSLLVFLDHHRCCCVVNAAHVKSLSGTWGKPLYFLLVFASSLVYEVECQERMSDAKHKHCLTYMSNSVLSEFLDFL